MATAEPAKVLEEAASADVPPRVNSTKVEDIPASIERSPKLAAVAINYEQPLASNESTVTASSDLIVITRTDRVDRELAYTDSASYLVVIRPDDYLGKIAKREYDNPGEWRNIYQWNKEQNW